MSNTGMTNQLKTPANGQRSPAAAGFTLFELIVTIAIIAILSALMGPTFVDTVDRNRQQSSLGSMFGMLGTARSEAVNRQVSVVACPSTDEASCGGSNWETGWIIFADDGGTTGTADNGALDGDEELIRIGQAASGTVTVRGRNFDTGPAITFGQEGFAEERGTVVICNGDPRRARAVVLNLSGQARLALDENDSGFVNDDQGGDISTCP